MRGSSFAKVAWVGVAIVVTVGAAMAGAATATATTTDMATATKSACGATACEVVLSCDGGIQKTVPSADGKFTFHDVPAGTCTVSVAEATTKGAMAPRETSSGMATGKRQHNPVTWKVTMDELVAMRTTAADAASSSVSVVIQQRQKELTGHVTLIK